MKKWFHSRLNLNWCESELKKKNESQIENWERDLEREREKGGVVDWDEDEIWCHVRLRVCVCYVMSSCTHLHIHMYIYICCIVLERERERLEVKIYNKKFRWKSRFWFIKVCVEIARKLWKLRVSFSSVSKNIDRNRDWNSNSYLPPYTRVSFAVYLRSTSYIYHLS